MCSTVPAQAQFTASILTVLLGFSLARADINLLIDVPGQTGRRLVLHLPANPGTDPLPLILAFHGGGGSAESFRTITGLNATSDKRGFAVAYMDAGDGFWGDYRPDFGSPDPDLAYVRSAIDQLAAKFYLDLRRVYATGLSNGGAFTFALGSELNDRVAAIAPVAHNLSEAFVNQATPDGPIHVLKIVGTADPLSPFNGGTQPNGEVIFSSFATMEYWRIVNGNGPPTSMPLPDTANDGTLAVRDTYARSVDGYELERIVVINGGHTWPGGLQYLPEFVVGRTSRDFSANEIIWDFFAAKTLSVHCPADLTDDGSLNFFDVSTFLGLYNAQTPIADFNADGLFNFFDVSAYLLAFNAGCP